MSWKLQEREAVPETANIILFALPESFQKNPPHKLVLLVITMQILTENSGFLTINLG